MSSRGDSLEIPMDGIIKKSSDESTGLLADTPDSAPEGIVISQLKRYVSLRSGYLNDSF